MAPQLSSTSAYSSVDRILILDFGSQYTELIARRVRESCVYCEIHPWDMDAQALTEWKPSGIILSGGPNSVHGSSSPSAPAIIFTLNVPILGICYGMQTMAVQLGGAVMCSSDKREFGRATIQINSETPDSNLSLLSLGEQQLTSSTGSNGTDAHHAGTTLDVWMSHCDKVSVLPPGFVVTAHNNTTPIAAMEDVARRYYAVQFHPEVTHTSLGQRILDRFVHTICKCNRTWTMANFANDSVRQIAAQVGPNDRVLLGLSGGVDSAVAALLIHRAIGDRLICVFVDTGLLRLNEAERVMLMFKHSLQMNIVHVNATEEFLGTLRGITDPEQKRKVIGRVFVDVFQREASKLTNVRYLAQGTIYPDIIESAGAKTKKAHTIKSHHNVGGLPETLQLKLLEPLRSLFKDEVRQLGTTLGLHKSMVDRHPFPGPGLGVRVLGEIKQEYLDLLRRADAIFIEELQESIYSDNIIAGQRVVKTWYDRVSQAFAVFLPVKSVGVMGDGRTYEWVIALRAVQTIDFMTAQWAELPYELLSRVSLRIINEVRGVNRVVYDISGKPPATIEWE